MNSKCVVFDLDDTLYKEIDFLKSAYTEISIKLFELNSSIKSEAIYDFMIENYYNKKDVFTETLDNFKINNIAKSDLLNIYRNHYPNIKIEAKSLEILKIFKEKKYILGIITDGRKTQQNNKIKALNLDTIFTYCLISEAFGSEKPSIKNYQFFEEKYKSKDYFYIGDNTSKDFVSANKLGWTTICLLDNGQNIHHQNFNLTKEYLPKYSVNNIEEIIKIIN